tara:strand:+ start:4830 stop:6329 length:1500 start_codon:yes stop_codon:yes gene_type:complete
MAKKERADTTAVIEPQAGPQSLALDTRRFVYELLFGGARGGGKTVYLLMDYAVDVLEYGKEWQGILFRRSYPRLDQIVQLSREMFPAIDPGAEYKVGDATWHFSNGAKLKFRHLDTDADADNYQGHSYSWIGFDELGEWPNPSSYNKLKATLRTGTLASSKERVFRRVRCTANPGGVGHGWIKEYFIQPCPEGNKLLVDTETNRNRMFIPSFVTDNRLLLEKDPDYIESIRASTQGNEQLFEAWLYGNWDIFFGRFFEHFDPKVHKLDPEDILEAGRIPDSWKIEGSLDYGEAAPTSFGLWATSPEGLSVRVAEYYQSGLWVSQHAGNIAALIEDCPYTGGRHPIRVWADPAIFHTRSAAGAAAMNRMVSDVFRSVGLNVVRSNNDRLTGWRYMKNLLAYVPEEKEAQIKYFPECEDFERQMLNANYAGTEANPKEDMNTDGEDHSLDEARYFCMGRGFGSIRKREESYVGTTFDLEVSRIRRAKLGYPAKRRGLVVVA